MHGPDPTPYAHGAAADACSSRLARCCELVGIRLYRTRLGGYRRRMIRSAAVMSCHSPIGRLKNCSPSKRFQTIPNTSCRRPEISFCPWFASRRGIAYDVRVTCTCDVKTMSPPIFTISTARQKFFSLFEIVTGHRGRKVVIKSRGSENHAVLVAESYLDELEAAAKRLRDIESGKAKPASGFKLIGSYADRGGSGRSHRGYSCRTESALGEEVDIVPQVAMSAGDLPLAVTDTHPLIWAATGRINKFGKAAKRTL